MDPKAGKASAILLRFYYAATFLFVLSDYLFGINIRIAALEAFPVWRAIYYAVCLGCLGLICWRPTLTLWVGTIESLFTLSLLIVVMGARVMSYSDDLLVSGQGFIGSEEIINFALTSGIAWIAYNRGIRAIHDEFRARS